MLCLNKLFTLSHGLGLALIAVAAGLTVWAFPGTDDTGVCASKVQEWSMADMLSHLKESGVELRVVSTRKDGRIEQSAFLTSTDRSWHELNLLPKSSRRMDLWNNTLYCERCPRDADLSVQAELWGENCSIVEPFVFFGDRNLLERVRSALEGPLASGIRSMESSS